MGQLLASPVGPWVVIFVIALAGVGLCFVPRVWSRTWRGWRGLVLRIPAVLFLLIAGAMIFGAGALAVSAGKIVAARPPEGRFVDVGGYRVFVTCEGPRTSETVLWLSGGYGSGAFMKPLHDRIKTERRSCLIDRPGTGWADRGRMPRSVDNIIREIHDGLVGAGEHGPLIVAGHSMGGLYAANYADAYPDQVRALVLLDPTPSLWFTEQAQILGCGKPAPASFNVWATAYGLGLIPAMNPLNSAQAADQKKALGPLWPTLVAMESRPQSLVAGNAAGWSACTHGIALVRTPGALGDLPVLKIVQAPAPNPMKWAPPGLSDREKRNWLRMRQAWEREYVDYTSQGVLVRAPPQFDHQFPIVQADWTLAQIRPFLERLKSQTSPAPRP